VECGVERDPLPLPLSLVLHCVSAPTQPSPPLTNFHRLTLLVVDDPAIIPHRRLFLFPAVPETEAYSRQVKARLLLGPVLRNGLSAMQPSSTLAASTATYHCEP
jgi:hypothetical protein